jgi:betaine-aldehyde dehydrogenase
VVFADADLPAAVEGIVTGGLFNAGQDCTAVTRVLVQEEIAERFQELLVAAMSEARTGLPSDEDTLYGPLWPPASGPATTAPLTAARSSWTSAASG